MDIDFNEMREIGFFLRIDTTRKEDKKKIDKHGGWKDVKFCPVCGFPTSRNTAIKYSYLGINSLICQKCNCLYNDKTPKNPNVGEYNIKNMGEIENSPDERKYDYRKKRFGEERVKIIQKYLDDYISLEDARLLDVGCNTGFFLDVAKQYCNNVEGIETSELIAEYAAKKLGVKVHATDLLDFKPPYTFDVITMFDVIEHIGNPFEFLYATKNLLNIKGIILIFTPNYLSLAFDILGVKSNLYFPSDHLLFFSKTTVEYIAKELDMDLIMFETKGMDLFDIMAFERDINKIDIANSLIIKNIDKMQKYIDDAGMANHMRFILKKR